MTESIGRKLFSEKRVLENLLALGSSYVLIYEGSVDDWWQFHPSITPQREINDTLQAVRFLRTIETVQNLLDGTVFWQVVKGSTASPITDKLRPQLNGFLMTTWQMGWGETATKWDQTDVMWDVT